MHMQVCTPRTRFTEVYVRVCTSIEYQCGIHVRSATKESDTGDLAHFCGVAATLLRGACVKARLRQNRILAHSGPAMGVGSFARAAASVSYNSLYVRRKPQTARGIGPRNIAPAAPGAPVRRRIAQHTVPLHLKQPLVGAAPARSSPAADRKLELWKKSDFRGSGPKTTVTPGATTKLVEFKTLARHVTNTAEQSERGRTAHVRRNARRRARCPARFGRCQPGHCVRYSLSCVAIAKAVICVSSLALHIHTTSAYVVRYYFIWCVIHASPPPRLPPPSQGCGGKAAQPPAATPGRAGGVGGGRGQAITQGSGLHFVRYSYGIYL